MRDWEQRCTGCYPELTPESCRPYGGWINKRIIVLEMTWRGSQPELVLVVVWSVEYLVIFSSRPS